MKQEDIFSREQGRAWHDRNRDKLKPNAYSELLLSVLDKLPEPPESVLDVGCSDGWLLHLIGLKYGGKPKLVGVEISGEAVMRGMEAYPTLDLRRGAARFLPMRNETFDLVVCSYVLHWVGRESLLFSLAQMDRAVKDGGHLLIADFSPDVPIKVPYKHREGVYTYKARYEEMFLSTIGYRMIAHYTYNHDINERGYAPSDQRATISVLRKGDYYAEG